MTIHDIVVNCGSIHANTLIIIANVNGEVKWRNEFRNLPSSHEEIKIKFFNVGFLFYEYDPKVYFKFYI